MRRSGCRLGPPTCALFRCGPRLSPAELAWFGVSFIGAVAPHIRCVGPRRIRPTSSAHTHIARYANPPFTPTAIFHFMASLTPTPFSQHPTHWCLTVGQVAHTPWPATWSTSKTLSPLAPPPLTSAPLTCTPTPGSVGHHSNRHCTPQRPTPTRPSHLRDQPL